MSVTPKSSWPWVRTLLHFIFNQLDTESVVAQYDRVLDALSDKLPKVAEHLDAARADLLAFTAFPKQIWRQIWSPNPRTQQGSAAAPMCSLRSQQNAGQPKPPVARAVLEQARS
jgi:hypothetical protein